MLTQPDHSSRMREFQDFLAAKVCLARVEDAPSKLAPEPRTRARAGRPRGREVATDRLAAIVLSAEDPSDLRATLDEALTSPAFAAYRAQIAKCKPAEISSLPIGPSMWVMAARETLLGPAVARRLYLADVLWLRAARRALVSPPSGPPVARDVSSLVMAEEVPLELRRKILAIWHGILAVHTTSALVAQGKRSPLAAELSVIALTGARAADRFLRLTEADLRQMDEAHAARERWLDDAFRKAAEGDGYSSGAASD